MNIGFIGLGNMGLPMAQNLQKAGHQVVGYDVADVSSTSHETQLLDYLKANGLKRYRSPILSQSDLMERFLSTCITTSQNNIITMDDIYDAYVDFVGSNEYGCLTKNQFYFNARMVERGYKHVRKQKRMPNGKKSDMVCFKAKFILTSMPFKWARLNGAPYDTESVEEVQVD